MDISYLDKEDEIRVQRLRKKLDRCKKALEEDNYFLEEQDKIETSEPSETQVNQ